MDPGAGGVTPTSQWRPTQSWWVGDDERSDDGGPNLPGSHHLAPAANDRRRSQRAAAFETDTGVDRTQQPEESVPLADPRCLFGPLPNSSFDGVLANRVQGVLERREAEDVAAPRSLSNDARGQRSVSFADTAGPRDEDRDGGPAGDSWRDECGRLQIQLASLTSEKERWERDRRRLRAEDVDRARDIEGLKRAVEAQSQLVMENLIAAQRLAATGAVSTPGSGRTPNNELLQHAWVPPSAATSEAKGSRWGGNEYIDSPWKPPSWEDSTSPGEEILTNHVGDDFRRSAWNDRGDSERRLSHRGAAVANAADTPAQSSATAAAAREASPPRDLDPVPILSYVTSREPPSAAGFGGSPSPQHPRGGTAIGKDGTNSANSRRHKGGATPSSIVPGAPPAPTEMVLAPRASALAREYAPQPGATAEAHGPTEYHDQPQTGWRRVVPRGNVGERRGVTDVHPHGGDEMEAGTSEVWEWNGRRVLVHIARPRESLVEQGLEGQASTAAGQQEEERRAEERTDVLNAATVPAIAADVGRSRSIVPESLLNDIESIRVTVQALATGAVGEPLLEPETVMEQTIPAGTDNSGLERAAGTANSGYLSPKPPESTRRQRSESSSYQQTGSTARRRVSSTPLAAENSNASSIVAGRPGGGHEGAQLASGRGDTFDGTQSETPESSSEARTDRVPTSGNERAGSRRGGSAGVAPPAGGLGDNGGDRGDSAGDDSHGRTPRREEGQGVDNVRPRELPPPEEEAEEPWGPGRGRGSGPVPAMEENTPPSPTTGKEGRAGEQRRRPSSPGGSCSGGASEGNPDHADSSVMNAAGSESGNENVPAEDIEGDGR